MTTTLKYPFHQVVADDFKAVNELILSHLATDATLIQDIGQHIISSGGKRLRPLLSLLSAKALGYTGNQHIHLAVIIEFIHTVSLLHDDVVDDSEQRRGRKTANFIWGNEASILVGDFLYSRAFQLMAALKNMRIMEVLADITNAIAAGEVLQLMQNHEPATTEGTYMEIIKGKTAKLFEAASHLGAVIADATPDEEHALAAYGQHLGMAFQMIDDLLDYSADPEETGKNLGDDLAEGKPTLPLIYSLKHGNEEQKEIIEHAILNGDREQLDEIIQIIQDTGALDYTQKAAEKAANHAKDSISELPVSNYKDALITLADFSVGRRY